jgi:hypothetical protein
MTVRRQMLSARDERERRAGRDGLKTEVFGTSNPDLQPSDRTSLARLD